MKRPESTIKTSDLVLLRNEYEKAAVECERQGNQTGSAGLINRGRAGSYRGVIADLNDLIHGKGHPNARRS